MGLSSKIVTRDFTSEDVANKALVIRMLQYEEALSKGPKGQALYANSSNLPLVSLFVEHTLNRMTLNHFGFSTSDSSVEAYRSIFRAYYRSPFDYDAEVLSSVHYMRENKCVYYKSKPLLVGDTVPDCKVYNLEGAATSLYDEFQREPFRYTVVAGFSMS